MKAPFSAYLSAIKPALKRLVELLGRDYDYVSVPATDSKGAGCAHLAACPQCHERDHDD